MKEAWLSKNDLWIYIETPKVKPHNVEKAILAEANKLGFSKGNIKCIVLDAWNLYESKSLKLIKTICEVYPETRLIVFNTIDDSNFQNEPEKHEIQREFTVFHLLSLPRTQIRKLIAGYNAEKAIGDEDAVLNKVISDLEPIQKIVL